MRQLTLLVAIGLVSPITNDFAQAQPARARSYDWPQWRGPQRDGVCQETGLLESWAKEGPPLRWQIGGLGGGYSTVAIVDGKVYTMGLRGAESMLRCLDVATGKEVWATSVGQGRPNSTPTVNGDLVYCLGSKGSLVVVNRFTGKEVWRTHLVKSFRGIDSVGVGFSESLLVDGDKVICTPGAADAILVALNKQTGKLVWRASVPRAIGKKGRDGAAYSSVVVSEAGGVRQYIQFIGRGLISVRADSGQVLWTYNRIANWGANVATPIVRGDFVFASSAYSTGAVLLELARKGEQLQKKQIYFLPYKVLQNHHGGLVLVKSHIYTGHGHNMVASSCDAG